MAKNTIKLKKYLDIVNEYVAAGTITPGMLVELTSAGKVQAHSSAGEPVLPMFALEDELQGNGIDDNYSADDQVQVWVTVRGEEVYALLKDGENVSIGDFLESDGAGHLQKYAATTATAIEYPASIVAVALEAVDLSNSAVAVGRIKVRVI